MLLQCITTRNPDDDMIEVAITAFKTVMDMDNNPDLPEVEFVVPKKRSDLLEEVKEKLANYGIEEEAEAEWILSLTLNVKRNELNTDNLVMPVDIDKVQKILNERITGRPLWYCIGDTEFYGYTFKVDERVLIPRPETELLVFNALNFINENSKILDLCTGSGAIAISIKKQKNSSVCAVDVSEQALELAKENANINGADVEFVKSDMFNELGNRKFDVILSNPPYIKRDELNSLQREVKEFEPMLALDGGADGLDFYRIIAHNAKNHLNENGMLFLECGIGQAEEVKNLLTDFSVVEIIKDYENIDRIIKAVL